MGGKGKLHPIRCTLINAGGEEIPVELTAAIIYEGDQEVATVGLFNDLEKSSNTSKQCGRWSSDLAGPEKWLPWVSSQPGWLMR